MPTKPTPSTVKAKRRRPRAGQQQRRPMMAKLYRQAAAQLRKQQQQHPAKPSPPVSQGDSERLLHELQVHQLELEMQNGELQKSREELETALEQYTDLYEFAPVGYFTLHPDSTIRLVNLTGTVLVGVGRARLVGQTFAGLLAAEARSEFHSFLKQVFAGRTRLSRDFELLRPGLPPRAVNMEAQRLPDGRQCRAVLVDITARLQAEQNVRESEERFRVMANAMPQLAWIARPDGHILWYNQRWYDYTGTALKQMEGWGWQSVHDPAVLPEVLKRWKASIATGEPFDMTFPLRGADGLFRPFLTRIIPLKNAAGQVVQWFGTNTDVAEQQRAEEKVRVSEVRYRRLFEAAHDGVLILDPATRKITDANLFMTELLGHQHAQLVGKELFEIGLLEDEAASRKMFRVLKKTHEVRYENLPLKNRSGRHQEVEVVANLYRENGHTVIQCNIRDITTRKAAERQLAEKARLLDLSHDAILVCDMQGRIRYWNHGAEEIYGWSQPEALGKVGRDLLQTEFSTPVKRMTAELLRAGHWTGELVQTSRAGRRITVLARLTLDRDGQNRPVAVLENFTDITKRKQVEDALHQSEHNLAAELAATQHLHQVSTQLIQADHVEELYEKILDTLVTIMRSDFASIQMFCPERGELRLVGFRGFNPQGAKYWEWVRPTSESTCGVALRTGQRSIVPDVRKCEWMAGSADLQAHLQIGIQAVQTTPLFSHSGALIGMLSTHWREPHDPSASELRIMDVLARQAADLIERKQAEEQLQQNNRTFLSLIQNAPFGLYVVDAQFRLNQVSTASQKVFENVRPLIGRDFEEVIRTIWPDPFASEVLARFRHTLETGEPYAAPNTVQQRHDNMAVESYDWKIERMTLPNGQFGVVCYFYDVTERNLAVEALRQSEERFRALATASSDVIYRMNADWSEVRHLDGRDFIADSGEPNANWLQEYIHPDDQPQVLAVINESIRTRTIFQMEHRVRQVDGTLGWTFSRAVPQFDAQGEILEWFGAASDVTERKRAEAALHESEARYHTLFNSIDEGYCILEMIFDEQGKAVDYLFLEVNAAFAKQCGIEDAVGRRMREIAPEHEEHWFETYGEVVKTGQSIRFVHHAKELGATWFDFYAFQFGGRESRKVAVIFNNITERRNMIAALSASEARYRNLFDSIDEGFCVIEMIFDEDNKPVDFLFLEANPAFEKQSGVTEATGRRMSEIVTAGVEAHWFETYGQVALTGEPVRFTNECKPLSRWFDIYACRVGGPESRKVAVVFSDITERKKTEQELAERARLLDLSHDAIVVRDMEGHIRYWNRGAEELYGWSRQEALGKISHLLLQTKFPTPVKIMTEELYRTDRWIGELGHATRAGRHLIVLARKTLDRDGQGQPVAVLENLTDITARKQGEEALRASEARFRTAVGVVTSLIWTNNAEGLMEGEQPGWASFTGQALAEYQGYGWAKAVHPQDGPPTVAVWKRAVAEKSIFEFEHRLRRRDGAWRLCSVRAVPVLGENGQIREWVGVHTDITERKQAEAALRESEERFRTLFASAPMGVFACDRNAVIEHCNQRAVELWGREPECGVERYCGSVKLWQPDGTLLPHEKSPMVEVLRTGQPALNVEICIQRPDGSLLPALVNIAALKNAEGEITGAITSFMDITERKQAEDLLRRSEAMFTALVEQSPLGVYVVDQQLRLQQVNPRAMSFFAGIEPLLGRSFSEILQAVWPHRVATEVMKRFRQTLKTGEPYQSPEFTERRRDTGLKQTYEWQIQRVTLRAGEQGVVCFFSNITARKKAEEAQRRLEVITATNLGLHKEIMRRQAVEDSLRKSEQHQKLLVKQAQQLAYQVRHAEEAERLRISRELHDQVAQTLVGINLQIGALTAHPSAPTLGFHEQLTKTQRLVEKSVDIVHAFARDLRPTLLDDLGLVPALDSFVKSFMERTGLPVRFTCFAGVEKLDNAKRTVLYRIAQEALNNVHKHAHATLVEMDICQLARHVIMTIQDNGRGASTDVILKAKGRRLGLVGMRERLEMVGGSFKILGVKGQGTTVQAKVPFRTVPVGENGLSRVLLTIKG